MVRGVLPDHAAHSVKASLLRYLSDNNAFLPNENHTVYEIYWSRAQMDARQHPHMEEVMGALLGLWRTEDPHQAIDLAR